MSVPIDKQLYDDVKKMANSVFKAPTGIFRSMWIKREYIKRGGLYEKRKSSSKIKRWLNEKWININNPIIKNDKIVGYKKCGEKNTQNNLYSLCRPTVRVSKDTPKLFQDISKYDIERINKQKQILRNKGKVKF
jgi:hypothetical protein